MTRGCIWMSRAETTRFDIRPGFALAAALLYFFDTQGIFTLVAVSAIVHELGHYLALRLFGIRPYLLRLELTGAAMYFDEGQLGYGGELLVALAGPLAGLLLSAAAAMGDWYALSGVSLVLSAFNLLPIGGLDGGRALRSLLCLACDGSRARRISRVITLVLTAAMLCTGAVLFCRYRCGLFLLLAAVALLLRREG